MYAERKKIASGGVSATGKTVSYVFPVEKKRDVVPSTSWHVLSWLVMDGEVRGGVVEACAVRNVKDFIYETQNIPLLDHLPLQRVRKPLIGV